MASSRIISSLYFLSYIAILVQTVVSTDPLFHFCSKSGNFTANSYYAKNLKNLLGDLYLKTPPTGFSTSSIGQTPDQTYGLSLCRGDVSSTNCKSCVVDASEELGKRCPYDKEAIIWYDNCLLKYSYNDFLGKIDNTYKFYMWNVRVVNKPESFNAKTKELLGSLVETAYKKQNLYASGDMELIGDQYEKLYGLVQCTRDLSSEDCKKCLEGIITEIPSCCDGKEGGRVVGGSCNFRYEIYPFVNTN
ncbi:antimicrobial ginkbilobin-2-like protein [Nicotiana tomentosiformis]|uniref:antimicrobial ginkbilobin-2-like protein n=1 Tax=Nicotiana tomentosiformis TaxID=4098 RepID=UPI00051C4D73|nr:cysteine-rich repeat secretory protein 38-like [Nicotiana tomentosiformis]